MLCPPDEKNSLSGKDPDAGKDWRQELGMTQDEMVGWHHRLEGHEFEQAPGVGDGQGSLACCSQWGYKELDTTEWLNWTESTAFLLGSANQQITGRRAEEEKSHGTSYSAFGGASGWGYMPHPPICVCRKFQLPLSFPNSLCLLQPRFCNDSILLFICWLSQCPQIGFSVFHLGWNYFPILNALSFKYSGSFLLWLDPNWYTHSL